MTTETDTNRGRFFVMSLLPWLLAGGMLLVYFLTLNHSANIATIYRVSELDGTYTPHRLFGPVTFLLTYPLRWLPSGLTGAGLSVFTAVCAALVLALLARSVALLPHDRTQDQRLRELSVSSTLSIPTAWLPPLFAVLVCGLQMTFWENATNSAGQTPELTYFQADAPGQLVNLLLFAYSIRCLLEYRINLKLSWVARFAFAYGLGMANDWLMICLFPGFLAALIWIRGLSFFNSRLLLTLSLAGLAGLAFIFLFPARTALAHYHGVGFWDALRYLLRADKLFPSSFISRELLLVLSLTSFIPIFVIGIRWASSFGDSSPIGIFFTTLVFHVFHAVFFMACIWVAFDPPFSPRQKAFDVPFLQLYYLGAVSIGYFAGYFLLIFGSVSPKIRNRPHPVVQFINLAVVVGVWGLAVMTPVFLVWKNLGQLHNSQAADAAFARMTSLTAQSLPSKGAIVLGDDRLRLLLLENHLNRAAKSANYLFLDTALLDTDPTYFRAITKKHPEFIDARDLPSTGVLESTLQVMHFLELMSQKHDIYYIHPSFGPYFERFYLEPHGLALQFKPYDTNTWEPPPLASQVIEDNNKAWANIISQELPIVTNILEFHRRPITSSILGHFMDSGHLTIESNKAVALLGSYYARSLDYWGVDLEKAGLLPEAGKCFANALQFNPNNLSARINSEFNQTLRAGKKIVITRPSAVRDEFGRYRSWTELLGSDGPFDDPSFCYALGETFAGGENYHEGAPLPPGPGNYLQAIQQFQRVLALAPDYANASYWLSKLYLHLKKNTEALETVNHLLERNPDDPVALFYQAVGFMQQGSYDKALAPLDHLLMKDPENRFALLERAISQLQLHNYDAAKADYEVLAKAFPRAYQVYYGLQEVAYNQKDTNGVIKNTQLYLTNYYQSFPTNMTPPETEEVKSIKQRLKEFKNGAP